MRRLSPGVEFATFLDPMVMFEVADHIPMNGSASSSRWRSVVIAPFAGHKTVDVGATTGLERASRLYSLTEALGRVHDYRHEGGRTLGPSHPPRVVEDASSQLFT
jgi:hypothetical protein